MKLSVRKLRPRITRITSRLGHWREDGKSRQKVAKNKANQPENGGKHQTTVKI